MRDDTLFSRAKHAKSFKKHFNSLLPFFFRFLLHGQNEIGMTTLKIIGFEHGWKYRLVIDNRYYLICFFVIV